MITFEGDTATVRFPWPTNDTGNGMLKTMGKQAGSAIRNAGRAVNGGIVFADIQRTDTGYEWVFTAKLHPEPELGDDLDG